MKNNPISKLSRLLIIIPVLLLLFSSCRQEEPYSAPSQGFTPVTLSVSVYNDPAPVSDDAASAIKNLCILQFYANENGSFGTLRHAGMCTLAEVGGLIKYQTRLLQSNYGEKYKLVVVANLPRHGFAYYQDQIGKSYAAVQQALLSESSADLPAFTAATPFPMFGIPGDGAAQTIGTTLNLNTVTLVRAVARVDIGIGKKDANANTWTPNGVKFNMTQVQIWKTGKQYAYMPSEGNFTATGGTLNITAPSPVGAVETKVYDNTYITNETYCAQKIYLSEADLLWGDVYDANHTNRPAIIVGGKFNGSQTETFYRVDFTKDDGSDEKMNILRNHIYQFTIKNITDDGYDTAQEAYDAKPQGLSYTTSIDAWQTGVENAIPLPQEGFLMSYGAQNGSVTSGDGIMIIKKSTGWTGENADPLLTVDYNTFYGEVPGNLKRSPAYPNGDIYPDLSTLTTVEGVHPALMVATDDVYNVAGSPHVHWKDDMVLTAFDMCRSYPGLGYSDWRLPRASELALMYLNRASLEKQRGFTAFSGTYWSGSEKGNPTDAVAAEAWAVNFDAAPSHFLGANKTSDSYKVRCVRQVSNLKK